MKTLEDLYKEVMASDELKAAFAQAAKDKKVADFLKAQGCDATEDEFKAFLVEKAESDKALSEEDLENVAGGWVAPAPLDTETAKKTREISVEMCPVPNSFFCK